MAYNSTIDKATDDILIYGNTAKDGSGTSYVPLLDADGQLQVDVIASGLPTGASTSANQTTIIGHLDGVEGLLTTIDADTGSILTSVDGLETSNSAIQTSVELMDDTVTAQGTALGTTKTILNGASVTTAAPTYTTGQISPLNMATTGALRVDVGATSANSTAIKVNVDSGGIASGGIASGAIASGAIASGAIAAGAIAAGATSIATTEDTASAAGDHLVKVAQIRLDTPVSGANLSASGDYTQFIADSFGKTWVTGTYAEDLAHVAGEAIVGNGARRIDTPASSAGTSGDWATMDSSAEGALWVTQTPTTTGGLSVANFNSGDTFTALTNTAQVIKASAGNFYGYYIYNPNSSATYVMLYNTAAASVTVGTTTPAMVFCIPATAGANLSLNYPITFSNAGWSIAAATTGGGNTAPATALEAMIFYK